MRVLIVSSAKARARHWAVHLTRFDCEVHLVEDEDRAIALLARIPFRVMLIDLMLAKGCALAVADFAGYRQPDLKVIFQSDSPVFSDGSIFRHCSNAYALVRTSTPDDDLAAMVEHCGKAG